MKKIWAFAMVLATACLASPAQPQETDTRTVGPELSRSELITLAAGVAAASPNCNQVCGEAVVGKLEQIVYELRRAPSWKVAR